MLATHFLQRVTLLREKVASFDVYPFKLPCVRELESLEPHPHVTFFVGENGSGKSTLLEAIAVSLGFNAEGGSRNFGFSTRESHSSLHEYLRIAKGYKRPQTGYFLRAESYFNLATEIEHLDEEPFGGPPVISSYGGVSLHEQSHGESFMALLTKRFGERGLYLLDEPEAALSPRRQLAALQRIHELVGERSQFIIATHSPILLAYPDAWIYQFTSRGVERVAYEDTEHYQVTREFLADPRGVLADLLRRGA
ncbi:MAG TPA: AAA family ATPase [Burkholderiaceae bacterium]